MASALSITSLTFTTISVLMFAGLCANYIQSDSIPIGYFTFIAGSVLSVVAMLFGDRSWASKLSLGLSISLFLVASASIMWGLRHAGH